MGGRESWTLQNTYGRAKLSPSLKNAVCTATVEGRPGCITKSAPYVIQQLLMRSNTAEARPPPDPPGIEVAHEKHDVGYSVHEIRRPDVDHRASPVGEAPGARSVRGAV